MPLKTEVVSFEKLVPGGQAFGQLADGRKLFAWGALPGETATVRITKQKKNWAEGIAEEIMTAAPERIAPRDPESYLSTSPWQIMSFEAEQTWKKALVREAFLQEHIALPDFQLQTNGNEYGYRNKMEFSFWWSNETNQLDLAFFRRGTHGKIPVTGSSLARPEINAAATQILQLLRTQNIEAYSLKTLLIRCSQAGRVSAQLYVKDERCKPLDESLFEKLGIYGLQVIYSNPKSPASVITKVLQTFGETGLSDTLLQKTFRYATEGFFQVNLPVYEQALRAMQSWMPAAVPVIDMYSGVGTIGLTIGGAQPTLVETNESCVAEMQRNSQVLGLNAHIVQANSEDALEFITSDATVILDPPRAGLHTKVVERLLETKPPRIVYLSCNPTTQARDVALLNTHFDIVHVEAFNFFPRTPHIESLVVLEPKHSSK